MQWFRAAFLRYNSTINKFLVDEKMYLECSKSVRGEHWEVAAPQNLNIIAILFTNRRPKVMANPADLVIIHNDIFPVNI